MLHLCYDIMRELVGARSILVGYTALWFGLPHTPYDFHVWGVRGAWEKHLAQRTGHDAHEVLEFWASRRPMDGSTPLLGGAKERSLVSRQLIKREGLFFFSFCLCLYWDFEKQEEHHEGIR